MYYLEDYNNNPIHVFVDQISLVEYNTIGFLSAIGSRKALEDVRHKLMSNSYNQAIRVRTCGTPRSTLCSLYGTSTKAYRFFFHKLDNAPFWGMTVIHDGVYHSTQDLVRGIRMTERMRKLETSGTFWSALPIYFMFRGAELFDSDEAMQQFQLASSDDTKRNILFRNPVFIDILYRKLASCSKLPFLREWMPALIELSTRPRADYRFIVLDVSGFATQVENVPRDDKIFTFKVTFHEPELSAAIQHGLHTKAISLGNDVTEGAITQCHTLTQYLNRFSEPLVRKAHERFDPLYTPGVSLPSKKALEFFTNTKYFSDLNFYDGQQDVICSVAKGISRNKRTLIVGECGSNAAQEAICQTSWFISAELSGKATSIYSIC